MSDETTALEASERFVVRYAVPGTLGTGLTAVYYTTRGVGSTSKLDQATKFSTEEQARAALSKLNNQWRTRAQIIRVFP